ncbi:phosphoribosyltransferase [Actinacidiphila yeochonensis]|uniref:phosphoribosyltransferase n=1 Tax=Actinacidiphila yeochonensis TaxID=89050 RepID=UPI00055A2CB5|nr:phosphoribosyltransferase [Actinacidiphila yeochonensis]
MPPTTPWTGQWVADRLGVALHGDGLADLLGLALRRNPKRAHLLVSNVLGKHVPQCPATILDHAAGLGRQVAELLGEDAADAVVLGYAETATGLGHGVADGLGHVPYLHSTRREVPGSAPYGGFEEEHSHATSHLLLPADPGLLSGPGPLVLVDDELSTGRTIVNTLTALHAVSPHRRYVVAALTDLRGPADRAALDALAERLGTRVDVVALATGSVTLPEGVLAAGQALVAAHEGVRDAPPAAARAAAPVRVGLGWPAGLPDGGRHGFLPAHARALDAALPAMGARLADALPAGARTVLVLGTEELMYAPQRLARQLQSELRDRAAASTAGAGAPAVRSSTTTRSPVLALDDPGYAIRSRIVFPAHDDPTDGGSRERYAYNVHGFDAVVCVVDSAGDTAALHAPGGLLDRLAAATGTVLLAVVPSHRPNGTPSAMSPTPAPAAERLTPSRAVSPSASPPRPELAKGLAEPLRGPAFSSYRPDEVGWLLQDLSAVRLEAPVEEREEAVQHGGAHYAESLPVEYQPTEEYQELFRAALDASAARIARAVGAVTELVLDERGPGAVLVSLARAGTPVGVLMRRWARHAHGLELPHYAVSIVRGRGIDANALRWIAAHHDPAAAVFVDGWTGKGAITRELAAALEELRADGNDWAGAFDPSVAVLADPGGCVAVHGTREDFLIPSACLNSTVSGLVSRTVLRADLVGPHDYHGAKFYRELAGADVSERFLDAVTAEFDAVAGAVAADVEALRGQDRAPTWEGWAAVERISQEYGIGDVNLVKPGVGETTRVLLRRVPWKILARRGAGTDLDHVRLLARQRGVPVEEVDGLPYSCVGLIHPHYTRGATGVDGRAVTSK